MKKARATITGLDTGHIPLDCDVLPMDNSKTKKEGVSRIYNGEDGFIAFLNRIIEKARSLTSRKILSRRSARRHDALDTRVALAGRSNVNSIIKWNPRREDLPIENGYAGGRAHR